MNLSKSVKSGSLVAKRKDKFILCGKTARPFGIYQSGYDLVILTDDGVKIFAIPTGIVRCGLVGLGFQAKKP